MITQEQIAIVCHQVNKSICECFGDLSQPDWENAPEWQKESAIKGVGFCVTNPDSPASANHDSWMAEKVRSGWKYGSIKNAETKEHPCMVSYDELPREQKVKDYAFKAVVFAMTTKI